MQCSLFTVFSRVCITAGPGVLLGTFLNGAAAYYILPYDWYGYPYERTN